MQRVGALITAAFVLTLAACTQRAPAVHTTAIADTPVPAPSATLVPSTAPSAATAQDAGAAGSSLPSSTPLSQAAPSQAAPTSPASVAPSAIPTVVATTAASTQGSPLMVPSDAPPEIVAVNITSQTVHGGDTISGTVETSSNVASVEAKIATLSISVPKVSVGRFALSYVVPNVPFFFHGTYPMTVIARNTAGQAVQRVIPIKVE